MQVKAWTSELEGHRALISSGDRSLVLDRQEADGSALGSQVAAGTAQSPLGYRAPCSQYLVLHGQERPGGSSEAQANEEGGSLVGERGLLHKVRSHFPEFPRRAKPR